MAGRLVTIKLIPVCRPKTEYTSLHSSHALRCLAANFFAKGAVSNEACISGKALGSHEPLESDRSKSARGWLYGGQWLHCQLVCGHLVELSQPEAYDEKYAKWRYDDLPILPEHWQYQVSTSTKKQFGILKKLMLRKDDSDEDEEVDVNEDYEAKSDDEPV